MSSHKKKELPKELFTSDDGPTPEPETVKAVTDYCKRVTALFDKVPLARTFTPAGPQHFAVKMRSGNPQYLTQGFNGDEEFRAAHAYAAKNGQPIYVFRPMKPSGYAFMEVRHEHIERLAGFKDFLDELVDANDQDITERVKKDREQKLKEEANRLAKMQAENPVFGSW